MGIPIVYFRSSSFNCHRMCPLQYYIEYTLGIRGPSGKAADKGTIVHKVLEICAKSKFAAQNNIKEIDDEDIGKVETANYETEYLGEIFERVYTYYTNIHTHHTWTNRDKSDCSTWFWKALKYKNGIYDPMNRHVVAAEPHFDFEIEKDWAKFDYPEYNLSGHLALKGTIDLITQVDDGVYEIIDWKTGARKDWATGKEYNYDNLFFNPQLRIYHYACKMMYPDVNMFMFTIYYIKDGGPYTIYFEDKDLEYTEEILNKKFKEIKETNKPEIVRNINPSNGWICKRLCHAGKTTFEDTHIEPIKETRFGQYTKKGETMSKCEQIRYMIDKHGIDWVTQNMKDPDHIHGFYKKPGSTD